MIQDKCNGENCEHTRAKGYILVDGLCLRCHPDAFGARKRLLQEQAAKLLTEDGPDAA